MKRYSIYIWFVAFLPIITGAVSCSKFLEAEAPVSQLISNEVFSNEASADAAVAGLYAQMTSGAYILFNSRITVLPGLSADELKSTVVTAGYTEFEENSVDVNNSNNAGIWQNAYNYIYHANNILHNLSSVTFSDKVKQQLTGEATFLRAFTYFYLVNIYGSVPLTTSPDYIINATLKREAAPVVYQQIIADLQQAEQLLQQAPPATTRIRATTWAAKALLARVYLYLGRWEDASAKATEIIASGLFKLADLNNVFTVTSAESILQLHPGTTSAWNSGEAYSFVPRAATVPSFQLRPSAINAFQDNDLRKQNWIGTAVVNGSTYYYPFKYKNSARTTLTEYNTVLRLAEQYLIRAEASLQQNHVADAVKDIDSIRKRAQIPLISHIQPAITATQLGDSLLKERQRELMAECGHRWFDLKRTGKASQVLPSLKPLYTADALLYPVPQAERSVNIFLDQNKGYQQ